MSDPRVDVVRYPSGALKAVPAGKGPDIARGAGRRLPDVVRDRVVVGAAAVAVVLAGGLGLLVIAYSLLIARNLLLGVVAATLLFGVAAVGVAAVVVVRWLATREAELLDRDVALQDAREQWEAEPVSAVVETRESGDEVPAVEPEPDEA